MCPLLLLLVTASLLALGFGGLLRSTGPPSPQVEFPRAGQAERDAPGDESVLLDRVEWGGNRRSGDRIAAAMAEVPESHPLAARQSGLTLRLLAGGRPANGWTVTGPEEAAILFPGG